MVYQVCLETGNSGSDATHLFSNFPDLLGDRYVKYLYIYVDPEVFPTNLLSFATWWSFVLL